MTLSARGDVVGRVALDVQTRLLHRARAEHPTATIWDAADLHWWWRTARASDDVAQPVWLDDDGEPVAALVLTRWRSEWGCDPITLPSRRDLLPEVMTVAAFVLDEVATDAPAAMAVRDDDDEWAALAVAHGFAPLDDHGCSLWMDAADAPPVTAVPAGYHLSDRERRRDRPHHFDLRHAGDEQERLDRSGLYRRDLDLCIVGSDDEVTAYGLFWADEVTGIGLVEPMRTEEGHMNRGLARAVLTAGIDRLVEAGMTRIKIGVEVGNAPAEHLYTSAGFGSPDLDTMYTRPAPI